MGHLILYVEDEKEIAEMFIIDFCKEGYEVIWAKNGQEALDMYEEHSPDIILLDVIIPVLDGFQVVREIRTKDWKTPILFLTLLTDPDSASKGLNIGANGYIRKDDDNGEMFARIRSAIRDHPIGQNPIIKITSDTVIDIARQKINYCSNSYNISFRDCNLLRFLVLNKNIPQKRDLLITQVWEKTINGNDYLSKSISLLRKIMSEDKRIKLIAHRGESVVLIVDE